MAQGVTRQELDAAVYDRGYSGQRLGIDTRSSWFYHRGDKASLLAHVDRMNALAVQAVFNSAVPPGKPAPLWTFWS